ncbi:hypothetical protein GOV12_07360 [Candidatus Pacearchaeota archaeon]|nr:hypothetical protein [Candidatus Pacearchaeota archaeon]
MKIELFGTDWEPQQTIHIERKDILVSGRDRDLEDYGGYRYTINNHLSGLSGYVEVVFWEIPELRNENELVADGFLEIMEYEDEYVCEIFSFYPYGLYETKDIPKNIQRSGVGTLSLDTVMHDLQTGDNIRNFFVKDPEFALRSLLTRRRGFELLDVDDLMHEYVYKRVA